MDVVKKGTVSVTVEHGRDRVKWRQMICCGGPNRKQTEEETIRYQMSEHMPNLCKLFSTVYLKISLA